MANTFKLKTKAGVTTLATVYTVPSSTTAIVLGCMLGNTTANSINCTVTVSSDTSDTETNADVELVTTTPIPGNSTLELLSGNKVVLQTTDLFKVFGSGAVDVCLSIMEIT
jgi:formate dehydrogenase assembly factor FdhD